MVLYYTLLEMIKLNIILDYLISDKVSKCSRFLFLALDIALMALWLIFDYNFMKYLVYSVIAELTLLAVISYLQTLKDIKNGIRYDAVKSVGKLFFEKRTR